MVYLKTGEEIELMRQSGAILKKVVRELREEVIKPGVTTKRIDDEAQRRIKGYGGEGSFNTVPGYLWFTTLPVNEQIVHTPPSERTLKTGDILTLDIGVRYKGYHTDHANTFVIGDVQLDSKTTEFLKVGKKTLYSALALVKPGRYIGEISACIQQGIEGHGYHIIKELTGHGLGKSLHEDPVVPGFIHKPIEKTYRIQPGLTIAVEVIYAMGTNKMIHEKGDDWSIRTADGSLAGWYEHTVAVSDKNTFILT